MTLKSFSVLVIPVMLDMFLPSQEEGVISRTFCCISVGKFLENDTILSTILYTTFTSVLLMCFYSCLDLY